MTSSAAAAFRARIAAITALLNDLNTQGAELIRRDQHTTRHDSYPTRASGAQPANTPSPPRHETGVFLVHGRWTWLCHTCGRTGEALNRRIAADTALDHELTHTTIDYPDPTGEAAIANQHPTPDPTHQQARTLTRNLNQAHQALQRAHNACHTTLPPDTNQTAWCQHHMLWGYTEPTYRLKLCRWCYDFQLNEHTLPPRTLIQHRALGGRITQHLVNQTLGPRRKGRQ